MPDLGPAVVILAYAVAIGVIALLPRSVLGYEQEPVWWRNHRFWAILVAASQIVVYALFG